MKTLLLGILIGVILWQLVCLIVNIFSNNENTATISMGIWYLSVWLIITLIYCLKQFYCNRKYAAMLIDSNGKPCYCNSEKTPDYLVNEKGFKWNEKIPEKYKPEDGWNEEHCILGVNIRYTPIKIAKLENAYKVKVSRKELKDW